MGHDITVLEPGSDVMEKTAHLFNSKYKNFRTNMFLCQASQSTLGINQEISPLKNNIDLHNMCIPINTLTQQ